MDAIANHYDDNVEYHSPFVTPLVDGQGQLRGRDAVRAYIAGALDRYSDLHFGPPSTVAVGAHSLSMSIGASMT